MPATAARCDDCEIRRHLAEKKSHPKPYGLRHLYAEIAYRNFAPANVTKKQLFAAILGHNNNDLETSLSYMTYVTAEETTGIKARAERVADRTIRQMITVNQIPGMVGG